jgi:tetratricopeptide (TPR) repeat protein
MKRERPLPAKAAGPAGPIARVDALQRAVDNAEDPRARLAALLALARHYAEASDGVRGLETSMQARALAMDAGDYAALSHALGSASISHYHRSDYLSAVATAMDAWECGRRAENELEIASSFGTIGLSLFALGVLDLAHQVTDLGLEFCAAEPELQEQRIRLLRLKGALLYTAGSLAEAEKLFAEATALGRKSSKAQLSMSLGNWGIMLLREGERLVDAGEPAAGVLARARERLQSAVEVALEDGDVLVATDRFCMVGGVAMLEGHLDEAEQLLREALERARELNYVRANVLASIYLGRLNLMRDDAKEATAHFRHAVSLARKGTTGDMLIQAMALLADTLEKHGDAAGAAEQRAEIEQIRRNNTVDRTRAAKDARELAQRILSE